MQYKVKIAQNSPQTTKDLRGNLFCDRRMASEIHSQPGGSATCYLSLASMSFAELEP